MAPASDRDLWVMYPWLLGITPGNLLLIAPVGSEMPPGMRVTDGSHLLSIMLRFDKAVSTSGQWVCAGVDPVHVDCKRISQTSKALQANIDLISTIKHS